MCTHSHLYVLTVLVLVVRVRVQLVYEHIQTQCMCPGLLVQANKTTGQDLVGARSCGAYRFKQNHEQFCSICSMK